MLPPQIDSRLQITAAMSLLCRSRLVYWNPHQPYGFHGGDHDDFEKNAVPDMDDHFGRLMLWQLFAAGSELLAKGVCLAHNLPIRHDQNVIAPPNDKMPAAIAAWLAKIATPPFPPRKQPAVHYGQLGGLVYDRKPTKHQPGGPPWFDLLLAKVPHTQQDREKLFGAYRFLAETIRNRDAHAYIPHVRDEHHWAAGKVMAPAFDLLVKWVPLGGARRVNRYTLTAGVLLDSLRKP